jgi:hypothetical protein
MTSAPSGPEAHFAADDHAVLLGRVRMLGHDRVGVDLDDRQGHLVALHPSRLDALPDRDRLELGQVAQVLHRFLLV